MERIIRNCDVCGKDISNKTYSEIKIGKYELPQCCENCAEATTEFINKRKEYFSDKNDFNIKKG